MPAVTMPVDPNVRYICPACGQPQLQALTFRDDYTGSAANLTTRCLACGLLRRYREAKLEKAR
jgi:RNase P subunit RPR2